MGKRTLRVDRNRHVIQGANLVGAILNINISIALGFVAVTIPADVYTKFAYLNTRDAAAFQISHVAAGTTYLTVAAPNIAAFKISLTAEPGDIICYVKGTTTTVLEVMLLT
jgi:hypothetical protein